MCPPLDAEAALRGEPPYAGGGAAAAIFVEGGAGRLAERERFARDALGQVFRGICRVSAAMEGGGCVLLLGGLPEWMGGAKLEEMASRVENTLQTCLGGSFEAICAGLAGNAAEAVAGARRAAAMNRYARAALRHVHRHHARQLSLHSMSSMLNLNESYFASLFKRETGASFIAYLNRYRVERARELLRAGQSVKSVAGAVGFESVSYFDRVYKSLAGETPSASLDASRRSAPGR
jgi:AraC-like DNA-binding protein